MKNVTLSLLIISAFATGNLHAQPTATVAKEKMNVFSSWVGHWQGEGSIQMGPGAAKKSSVDEHVEFKLDGAILVVEGIGKAIDSENKGEIAHHAYAILYFDQGSKEYKFNTHLKDGRNAVAWFKVVVNNKYQWGFDVPSGKVRYSIQVDAAMNTWNEIGEFSSDGSTWNKFFEMNLTKI